jgi:hypothetical protein
MVTSTFALFLSHRVDEAREHDADPHGEHAKQH